MEEKLNLGTQLCGPADNDAADHDASACTPPVCRTLPAAEDASYAKQR
ncbi:MAG: hypothetical protein R3F19_16955 [Verrucomicrobiales bacterium]